MIRTTKGNPRIIKLYKYYGYDKLCGKDYTIPETILNKKKIVR